VEVVATDVDDERFQTLSMLRQMNEVGSAKTTFCLRVVVLRRGESAYGLVKGLTAYFDGTGLLKLPTRHQG